METFDLIPDDIPANTFPASKRSGINGNISRWLSSHNIFCFPLQKEAELMETE